MSSYKSVQWVWTRRWTDWLPSRGSQDEPLFEKLRGVNDEPIDDVDRNENDDDEQDKTSFLLSRPDQRRQRWRWAPSEALVITGLSITSLLLLITTIILWRVQETSVPETIATKKIYHCGNSTSEARALGCEFDMLSYSWTPQICYDSGTAREFRAWLHEADRKFGAFPFFYDEEGMDPVPDEVALSESYGRTIHTTQEEHLGHCTFLMRRWHRLAAQHVGAKHFNHRFGKFVHTKHCTNRILNVLKDPSVLGEDTLNSKFGITFEKC